MAAPPKVIIIGGGLAGPVLALCLKQHGIASVVFELRNKDAADGGFLALAPNALRVLAKIGLYERVSTQGWNFETMTFLSSRNLHKIGSVLNGSLSKYGYEAVRVPRGAVRRTVLDALEEQGIPIHYGMRCSYVSEDLDAGTVTAAFTDGHRETGDFLVGTDGIHSRVRKYLFPEGADPTFSGMMGLGGSIAKSKLDASVNNMPLPALIIGKANSFALMPCTYTGDRIGCFATMETNERTREQWATYMADKAAMSSDLAARHPRNTTEWPAIVPSICAELEQDPDTVTAWPFYSVPKLDSWSSPSSRVLIIGDSAHAIPPTGGQGAAMAFEDAATLADALNLAASPSSTPTDNTNLQAIISRWQSHRQQRIAQVVAFTARGGDMRRAKTSTLQQIIKEWIMWLYFTWLGPEGGLRWAYSYDTSEALKAQDQPGGAEK